MQLMAKESPLFLFWLRDEEDLLLLGTTGIRLD
jgi:hypothetical protein